VRLRVIGIGSPNGDDAAGPAVAQRLAREGVPSEVEVLARSRPGLDLVYDLCDVDGVVLVDALCGGEPGAVRCVDPEELAAGGRASHAFGVADALALAAVLDARPANLRIVAISVASRAGADWGAPLSPAVRAAIAPACDRVRAELRALLGRVARAGQPV
jgi:hydrogenase maturation protease